jgi:hypothetical protein
MYTVGVAPSSCHKRESEKILLFRQKENFIQDLQERAKNEGNKKNSIFTA